tara:strand:+ start:959 stop:1354 length:396 start_codon:yes stop_codon:yes gene_type:complete
MAKFKSTPSKKFGVGAEVIGICGNSRSTKYKVVDINWYETTDSFQRSSCWEYTCINVSNPKDVQFSFEWELKLSSEICKYEVYGSKMIGETVKDVDFDHDDLIITFENGSVAKFGAGYGQCSGYLTFEDEE